MGWQTVTGGGAIILVTIQFCNLFADSFSNNSHEQAVLAGNWIYIDGGDIMNQEGRYLRST